MALQLAPITEDFGAVASGIDLRAGIDAVPLRCSTSIAKHPCDSSKAVTAAHRAASSFCALSSLSLPLKLFGSVLSNSKPLMRRDATLGRPVELVFGLCSYS